MLLVGAWLLWIFAAAYGVLTLWSVLPLQYRTAGVSWAVEYAYWGVVDLLTYRQWVGLVIALEYLIGGAMIAASLLIISLRPREGLAVTIAALLFLLPVSLGPAVVPEMADLPAWLASAKPALDAMMGATFLIGSFVLLFFFPTGRMAAGWPGRVGAGAVGGIAILLLIGTLAPMQQSEWGWFAFVALAAVAILAGVMGQWHQYRQSATPRQREQTRWALAGTSFFLGVLAVSIVSTVLFDFERVQTGYRTFHFLLLRVAMLVLPLSLALALLRDGLWGVQATMRRALVYVLVTGAVLISYVLAVGALSLIPGRQPLRWVAVVATGLIALLAHPLRMRIQGAVNRLAFGDRDDPVTVLYRLGRQLESSADPAVALQAMPATVARSLNLPYAALELTTAAGTEPLAQCGQPVGDVERFALAWQGETLGALVVSPRTHDGRLSKDDRRLLDQVVLQAGSAIQALQMTRQLQQSRQAIVLVREEERRRLRRELHDGLGPLLASQALTQDVVARRLEHDPAGAAALLQELKQQTQEAIRDIRRIVYDLRPPALDDLGLLEALHRLAQQSSADDLPVIIACAQPLPPLPAAVEVAAYRIAQEAITNSRRHAQPTRITLTLAICDGSLLESICDDGIGLPPGASPGVGIRSMHERAAELGGTLTIQGAQGGGTCVHSSLPIG